MTGAELKEFVTDGLDVGDIGDTEFYILLNAAKTKLEEERDWKILETTDSSKTVGSGDTFLTTKALPSDFSKDIGLFLTNSNNNPLYYSPVPYRERHIHKDIPRRYYIDLANSVFGLTGASPSGYTTINLIYRKFTSDIASGSSWAFPARFHPVLGFIVAEMFRGGVDFDAISAKQMTQNRADALALYYALLDWDTALRIQEQGGSYEDSGNYDASGLPTAENKDFPLAYM